MQRNSPHRFPEADHELSDAEIEATFGEYVQHCRAVFQTDVSYLVSMAKAGNRIHAQKEARAARDAARHAAKAAKAAEREQRRAAKAAAKAASRTDSAAQTRTCSL